ncbi:MAG: TIGR01212 family radical SAM protein [Campylobacterota bacterium]|nr:TIGR01212 family radical SAM protein [Campylobacterota bacterium]
MRHLNTIGRYWRDKYGEKVYKIPISISGFTCPNIDGTVAKGGCTFCENESFSPNLEDRSKFKLNLNSKENPYLEKQLLQLQTQFEATKKVLQKKFGANKFIVYFQSFTNTYAPLETLKALYEKALGFDDVVGLSIGTRTDCITEETLDYLQELSQRKLPEYLISSKSKQFTYEIWVEYGIQSIYDEILERINRGHDFANIKEWIKKTKDRDLLVCGHMIFGLPGETQDMMLKGVEESVKLGIDSIKFHPLYVVKNTLLTNEYKQGKFTPISEELYIDTLVKSIKMLPDNVSISRVTAGISDDSLLDPLWCNDKHRQIYNIKQALLKEGLVY